jgi:hypothetical protein
VLPTLIYEESIKFLKEFQEIKYDLFVDRNSLWKPYQRGVILATETALDVQQLYLQTYKIKFIMLGRLTQDALENIFSSCRARNPVPNPKEFKTNLRLITLSQYSKKLDKLCRRRHKIYTLKLFLNQVIKNWDGAESKTRPSNLPDINLNQSELTRDTYLVRVNPYKSSSNSRK